MATGCVGGVMITDDTRDTARPVSGSSLGGVPDDDEGDEAADGCFMLGVVVDMVAGIKYGRIV